MVVGMTHGQNECSSISRAGIHLGDEFILSGSDDSRCVYIIEREGLTLVSSFGERTVSDGELNSTSSNIIIDLSNKLPNFILLEDGLNSVYIAGKRFVSCKCSFDNGGVKVESKLYFSSLEGSLLMLNFSYPGQNNTRCVEIINTIMSIN